MGDGKGGRCSSGFIRGKFLIKYCSFAGFLFLLSEYLVR